jgi:SAM-dependent methyltransferase
MNEILSDTQGNEFELRPKSCPICGDAPRKLLGLRGGRYHRYGLGVVSRIVQCTRCSLIFPDPFPYPRNAQRLYGDPDKYFENVDEEAKVEGYRQLVRELGRRVGRRSFSLLDVGSGRAELVRAASAEGVEAVGLELSQAMIERAKARFGMKLLPASIEELADAGERRFDAVVLNAVLEHVYDPDSMVRAAARLLAPHGVLYVDIPQEPNLLTLVGNAWNRACRDPSVYNLSPTWPPYHVFGFNRRAMTALFGKHRIVIEDVRICAVPTVPSQGRLQDRVRAFIGTQINRVANYTGTASNMFVWARTTTT